MHGFIPLIRSTTSYSTCNPSQTHSVMFQPLRAKLRQDHNPRRPVCQSPLFPLHITGSSARSHNQTIHSSQWTSLNRRCCYFWRASGLRPAHRLPPTRSPTKPLSSACQSFRHQREKTKRPLSESNSHDAISARRYVASLA